MGPGQPFRLDDACPATTAVPFGTVETPISIVKAAFSPDNRWLATMGPDRTICLWDFSTRSVEHPVTRLASSDFHYAGEPFSPDGRWLVTLARGDRTLLLELRDLSTSPPRETALVELESIVAARYVFSRDARWLAVSANGEGTFLLELEASPVGLKRISLLRNKQYRHLER